MEQTEQDLKSKLLIEAWDSSLYSFGYGFIFDKRANKYSKLVSLLKVFGIVVPSLVGATVLGYGIDNVYLKNVIAIAIPIGIIQFCFSVLAVIFEWDNRLAYSYESSQDHKSLSERFKKLANYPNGSFSELQISFDLIKVESMKRTDQDSKQNISEKEKRRAMRYSLRQFQRKCVSCKEIPLSMHATKCPVCGQF